ncbi:MAG: ABC transporter substrate-binding protein [Chloroflexota bacterium]|nr:ABC transporter substrate-binding protein [Chloroflexota bacterium]
MKQSRSFALVSMVVAAMLVLASCGSPTTGTGDSTGAAGTAASVAAGGAAASAAAGGTAASAAAGGEAAAGGGLPKVTKKDKYKVGFAQVESNGAWRIAQSESMKAEAAKRGYELIYTDATGSEAKQIADVDTMIAQKVDAIFLAPKSEKPLAQAVLKAKAAGIPVFLLDRNVDQSLAKPGQDYVAFMGSDFVEEGKRAAEWLIKATGGNAKIIQLEGTVGSSPAIDRKKGFDDAIKSQPGMQLLASDPSGDFDRDKGRQAMETLLQAHPDVTAVYAHNDEMAIGAIAALEQAGKVPGKDVIIVSIDGTRDALQAIIDGKLGATVECNPRFGPAAFDALERYAKGEQLPAKLINPDKFFDSSNAATEIANAY